MASLTDVIVKIPKVKKYEVFVVDLMAANFQTVTIAAKKNKQKFQNELSIALDALKLSSTLELHDWGGVIGVAKDDGRVALATGQDIGVDRLVFSYTPWSDDKIDESGNVKQGGKTKLPEMAQFAKEAGFRAMVVMTKKEGNCGKADTFNALRQWGPEKNVAYFEDTYDVLKLCVASLSQDSDTGTCVLHFVEPVDPNHQVVKNPDIAIVHESRQNYLERWQQHGDTTSVNSGSTETKQSNTSSKDKDDYKGTPVAVSEAGSMLYWGDRDSAQFPQGIITHVVNLASGTFPWPDTLNIPGVSYLHLGMKDADQIPPLATNIRQIRDYSDIVGTNEKRRKDLENVWNDNLCKARVALKHVLQVMSEPNNHVLVNCNMGINRSGAVVLAYMLSSRNKEMSYIDDRVATDCVRELRDKRRGSVNTEPLSNRSMIQLGCVLANELIVNTEGETKDEVRSVHRCHRVETGDLDHMKHAIWCDNWVPGKYRLICVMPHRCSRCGVERCPQCCDLIPSDLKLPRVHFKFPPPEFMNVNDQHYLADDTNSPKEWQKKKSAKEAKELAGSWCRELLQSAMDDDDKEQFQELLDGIGSGPPTNLNATWTVQSQELTLGGVLARRAGRTGKAWALSKLGNHLLGGTNSLIMFATDEKQTPLFYSFHNGNQQCCNVIVTIIEAEIERLKVLQKKASDEDNDEEKKRIKVQIKNIPDQQEILNQLRHERDHPVEDVETGNLFGDPAVGDGDY